MLIAQITDTHITRDRKPAYNRVDTAAFLERAVAHVNAMEPRPDIVVMTGDLVDEGSAGEYAILRDILAPLSMPVYLMPGNHDERGALRAGFPDHEYLAQGGEWMQDPDGPTGYLKPALAALGIRERRLYDTRHTYATMCLMAGMNVAFIANQLGHTVEVLLSTYAEWINTDGDWTELNKLVTAPIGTKLVQQESVND